MKQALGTIGLAAMMTACAGQRHVQPRTPAPLSTSDTAGSVEGLAGSAAERNRLLVVFATLPDCGCGAQVRTFEDARLARWLEAHADAVHLRRDPDAPTPAWLEGPDRAQIVVFRDGAPVARVGRELDAPSLNMWLDGVRQGEGTAAIMRRALGEAPTEPSDVRRRYDYARVLVDEGQHAAAADAYVWLYTDGDRLDPDFRGTRVSFLLLDMANLAAAHPAEDAKFERVLEPRDYRRYRRYIIVWN